MPINFRNTVTSDGGGSGSKKGANNYNQGFKENRNPNYGKNKYTPTPTTPTTRTVYVNNTPSAPEYNSGGRSGVDDSVNYIRNKLKEQEAAAKAAYKAQYEQALLQNTNDYERNRNQANRVYFKTDRFLRGLYGNQVTGKGLSSRAQAHSSWNNMLSDYLQDKTRADSESLAQYQQNLSNVGKTLAQGWYNYVLPVYTNRQINDDNLVYRSLLARL